MKSILILSLSLLSFSALSTPVPDGHYHGKGSWFGRGKTGTMVSGLIVNGKSFEASYETEDGKSITWAFEVEEGKDFFLVSIGGTEIGSGYCLNGAPVCHYQIKTDALKLEENLVLHNGHLYRYGSKLENDVAVRWQEDLVRE